MSASKHRLLVRTLVACALGAAGIGCAQWVTPFLASDPYATGTWIGRLVVVTMRDFEDREYAAAAMDIETGPRVLKGSYGNTTVDPEHDLVVLCRGQGIIDPAELDIPAGSRIRVRGRLSRSSLLKSFAPRNSTGGIMEPVRMVSEGEKNNNFAIDIGGRAKPKVLEH